MGSRKWTSLAAQIDGHAVLFITIVPIVLPNVTWAGAWWPMAWGMALWEMVCAVSGLSPLPFRRSIAWSTDRPRVPPPPLPPPPKLTLSNIRVCIFAGPGPPAQRPMPLRVILDEIARKVPQEPLCLIHVAASKQAEHTQSCQPQLLRRINKSGFFAI
jgi:hypothetical protein